MAATSASELQSSPHVHGAIYLDPNTPPLRARALLDTGAEASVMEQEIVDKIGASARGEGMGSVELCSPLGGCQRCNTLRDVCICVNNEIGETQCFKENFVIIEGSGGANRDDIPEVILSYDTIKKQGLFQKNPSLLRARSSDMDDTELATAGLSPARKKPRRQKLRAVRTAPTAMPTGASSKKGDPPGGYPTTTPDERDWSPQIVRAGRRRILRRRDVWDTSPGVLMVRGNPKKGPLSKKRTRSLTGGERRAFRRYHRLL